MSTNPLDLEELKALLKVLRENGVAEITDGELSIKMSTQAYLINPLIDNTIVEKPEDPKKREEQDLYYSTRFGA